MEAVFLKILNMSISAVWLIIAVAVLRVVFKKAPKTMRVVLWGLAALRLMIPFSFESVLSLIPSGETFPQNITVTPTPSINSGVGVIDDAVNPIIIENLSPIDVTASVNPMQIVIFAAAAVWVLGMIVMLMYCIISYALLYGRVKASLNEESNIYLCDDITSPFILGVFKPRIYIPSYLKGENVRHVLAHERAHIKRLDHLWKPIGFAVLTVHWFNPLVWIAYVLLCRDIEFACDEKVIKTMGTEDIRAYSETLLSCSVPKKMITACPVAFGEVGVKQRIKSVLNYKKPLFWVVIAAVVICIATAVFFLTSPPADYSSPSDGQSGTTEEGAWFDAVIIEDGGERWLVRPCEGTAESRSSDKIYVKKTDKGSEKGSYGVDSIVRIYYDGIIQEIYPAIIPNVSKIELKDTAGTKILFEYKSAWVKYVTDRNDPIYANAVNSDELSGSNAPIHVFDDLESFGDFIRPYALVNDGEHGVEALLKEYNKAYFVEKSVILIYSVESTGVHNIPVKMVRKNNGLHFQFNIIQTDSDLPFGPKCQVFAVEISKKDLEGCDVFYASPTVDEKLKDYPKAPAEGNIPFEWKAFPLIYTDKVTDKKLDPYLVCQKDRRVYRFDTHTALKSVGSSIGQLNQYPSVNANWYDGYGEDFFKDKLLLVVYISSPSGSITYEISGVGVNSDGNAEISLLTNVPEEQTYDMAQYALAVEIERKHIEGCGEFAVKETTVERNVQQKNLVVFSPPDNVNNIKIKSVNSQMTGILDRKDLIFTDAVNKDSLNNNDGIHLPLHVFGSRSEYESFIKRYEGVAGPELPDNERGSIGYYTDFTFKNNKVVLLYVDPKMAAKGGYNLTEPILKDGRLIFPIVNDGWYKGRIEIDDGNIGKIVAIAIPNSMFEGVTAFDAVAFESAEEYNGYFGLKG